MTTDNLNFSMRESLAEIDEYGDKSVDQLVAEAMKEDSQEEQENTNFEEIINKYANI